MRLMANHPPYQHLANGPTCQRVQVPAEACYLRFSGQPGVRSEMLDMMTARDERLIVDYDAKGRVVGIELIGPGKPCQEG